MAKKITWEDKEHILPYGTRENQVWDLDMNEIKTVVNANADKLAGLEGGYQGVLLIADTPTNDGYYLAGESGTYTNAGSLVVDLTNTIVFINKIDTNYTLTEIDVPVTLTQTIDPANTTEAPSNKAVSDYIDTLRGGEVASGETKSVSGDKIYNSIFEKELEVNGEAFLSGYYVNSSGGLTVSGTRKYTDYKDISNSDKIIIRGYTNGGSLVLVAYYDEDKNFISALTSPSLTRHEILKASFPSGAKYIRCSGSGDGNDYLIHNSINGTNERIDAVESDILNTEIEINGDVFLDGFYIQSSNGVPAASATRKYTDFKNISNAEKITLRGYTNGTSIALLAYYDEDKNFISALTSPSLSRTEILKASFPSGAVYVRATGTSGQDVYLFYNTLDELSQRVEGNEKDIETLNAEVEKSTLIVESTQTRQSISVNDTPTDLFNLNQVQTETTISGRTGYGNNILPASNKTVNLIKLIPVNEMINYSDYALIEIYNVTDGLIEFSYKLGSIVWNNYIDEKVLIALENEVTLQSGKSYQLRYRIIGESIGQQNYKRVTKATDEVPTRCSYVSSWVTSTGDYNVLIEAFNSSDYFFENEIVINPEQVVGLQEYIEGLEATVELFIPDEIIVAKDTTIEIYSDQIIDTPNKHNFHIDYSCTVGQHKKRKFTVTGTAENLGTYSLGVTVRNNDLKEVASKTVSLKIIDKTTLATPYRLLPIGASYTNNKPWYDEWKNLALAKLGSRDKIDFVGTINGTWGKHEGRSGWSATTYNSGSTDEKANIILTVSGVTEEPILKKGYNVPLTAGGTTTFEVEIVNLTAGSGTIQLTRTGVSGLIDSSGAITEVESGTVGDASISYSARTYDSVNPFWNDALGRLDFANYSTVNGIPQPDGVQFLIGTNSLSGGESGIDAANLALKSIIDRIILDWGAIDIFICLIPFLSDQNGLGKTYGSGSFGNKENLDHLVFYTVKTVYEMFKNYSNVYFTPIAQTHDSEFNFGKVEIAVNPRNSNYVEYDPIESTHPTDEGYYQFADAMFCTWLNQI